MRQVGYALLTRAPVAIIDKKTCLHAAPRLACVKPVASVHPEPGSNSTSYYLFFSFFLFGLPRLPTAGPKPAEDKRSSGLTVRNLQGGITATSAGPRTVSFFCHPFKDLFRFHQTALRPESECKSTNFIRNDQITKQLFSDTNNTDAPKTPPNTLIDTKFKHMNFFRKEIEQQWTDSGKTGAATEFPDAATEKTIAAPGKTANASLFL